MAFVVEDGTGKATATAYVSVAYADTYFNDSQNTTWSAATDDAKQGAIIKATRYIDGRWEDRMLGQRQFVDVQALAFPRYGYDKLGRLLDDVVPTDVKKACAEYALRALSGDLARDPSFDTTGKQVQRTRRKVGPIETETEYSAQSASGVRSYPEADFHMRAVLRPAGLIR